MSFLSGITDAEVKFIEAMNDEFDMDLNYRAPKSVIEMRPNAKCPVCEGFMTIAGWIEARKEERAEGKQIASKFTCLSCQMFVIPKKIR